MAITPIKELIPEEAQEHIALGAQVLDVRTKSEYVLGHIEGCFHADIYGRDFAEELQKFPKEETYVVYCGSGGRSGRAVEMMSTLGFKNAYNLAGGITAWKKKGMLVTADS